MYYDPEKNAMFDAETGALIPLAEGDDIPAHLRAEVRGTSYIHKQIQQKKDFAYARSLQTDLSDGHEVEGALNGSGIGTSTSAQEEMMKRDHEMAMALSLGSQQESLLPTPPTRSAASAVTSSYSGTVTLPPAQSLSQEQQRREQEAADHAFALSLSSGNNHLPPPPPSTSSSCSAVGLQLDENPYFVGGIGEEYDNVELMETGIGTSREGQRRGQGDSVSVSSSGGGGGGGWFDDLSLARALQAMEFEIASEMRAQGRDTNLTPEQEAFNQKENKASKCKRQMVTMSTFMCLVQIGMLVAMIQDDGYAPKSENPTYGPSAYTMVRYGAKVAVLIKYEDEWWRLVSPIFLHAGVIHIISNVGIQLRVGGYLELVFGRASWLFIYFSSGIYGNMLSCIFLPNSVGIGSSGAVLGMLTAWIVWILFRWYKVPKESRGQRNCQLVVVTAAVVLTLAFSFSEFVDWAAHFGGAIQGGIAAAMMLSREVENFYMRWAVRTTAAMTFVVSYTWALVYMLEVMSPSKEYLEYYEANDDWGR